MKPVLAAIIALISLSLSTEPPMAAEGHLFPKVRRIILPLHGLDCRPRRMLCVYTRSANAAIHVLRCRIDETAFCVLTDEKPIEHLTPDAKILKIAQPPGGFALLIVRGHVRLDQPPSAGK